MDREIDMANGLNGKNVQNLVTVVSGLVDPLTRGYLGFSSGWVWV